MSTCTRVVFSEFARDPAQVARVESFPLPEPGPGQLRLRMRYASINPADINVIQGTYGSLPDLPATPGIEGCGTVDAIGSGVAGFVRGQPVLPIRCKSCWSSHVIVDADGAIPLPGGIDLQQAAMLKANPPTAWILLNGGEFPAEPLVPPGGWVVQNAANSAVGQCVIQLAKVMGIRTINLVRRDEARAEMVALGGDVVLLDEPGLQLPAGCDAPLLALNCVGGQSALRTLALLAAGGRQLTYGAMSRQPLKIPNGLLIFRRLGLGGFWLTAWLESAPPAAVRDLYTRLATLVADGALQMSVEAVYPVGEIFGALTHAQRPGRRGKILLEL